MYMQQAYTKEQLFKIAGENYETLRNYCAILMNEGYWDGAANVLNKPVYDILDLYIQSVLVQLTLFCGSYSALTSEFIANLPQKNILKIIPENPLSQGILDESLRIFNSPPILLQLFGWRDSDKHTGVTGLFFDALLNIQLSMAYLNISKTVLLTKFIREYYRKIEMFIYNQENYSGYIDEKYIFLKLCNGELEYSNAHLIESGEDFEYYKRKYLFYKDSASRIPENNSIQIPAAANISNTLNDRNEAREEFPVSDKPQDDKRKSKLDELLEELEALIGLSQVKAEVKSLVNLIKVKKMREKMRLPSMDMSFHMVFTGSPGTGKTTVARLIAAIYRELGLLSKGTLIETDRAGLVAGYVGQTALKVKDVVDRAVGGVLFIDEAYSLAGGGSNDFGEEAIDTLVKMMEDHRENLVVIVAGYTDEMNRFLKSNTGLISRFNKFVNFPDYSNDELISILNCMADKSGFVISTAAETEILERLDTMTDAENRRFGNARGIRNVFERLVINQANRIVEYDSPDENMLTTIIEDDVLRLESMV